MSVCGVAVDRTAYLNAVSARIAGNASPSQDEVERILSRYSGGALPEQLNPKGLGEIARRYCLPTEPRCHECPLRFACAHPRRHLAESDGHTLVDLFCGAGGLSLGFELEGFAPLLAIDNDRWATHTYRYNRPRLPPARVICADVETWMGTPTELGARVDVVAGGVPCQSFSNANRQRREEDPRDSLFAQLFGVVDVIRPKAVLIENVSGFREVGPQVEESFRAHRFAAQRTLLNAVDFGVPQRRRRLFFVGFSEDHFRDAHERARAVVADLDACLRQPSWTLQDAIGDLPPLSPATTPNRPDIESNETGWAFHFHDLRHASAYARGLNSGRTHVMTFNHKSRFNNDRDIEIFSRLRPGENSLSDSIRDIMPYSNRNHIFKDKYYRLRADEPCRTITAHMRFDCNMYIHPHQSRGMTVREAARVQGFPDDYVFTGTFQSLYRQVGNAVPPPLARRLASAIRSAL